MAPADPSPQDRSVAAQAAAVAAKARTEIAQNAQAEQSPVLWTRIFIDICV